MTRAISWKTLQLLILLLEVLLMTVVSSLLARWLLPPLSSMYLTRFLVLLALIYSVVQLQIGTKLTCDKPHVVFHHSILTVIWFVILSQLLLWITQTHIGTSLFFLLTYGILLILIPSERLLLMRFLGAQPESAQTTADVLPPTGGVREGLGVASSIYKRTTDILIALTFLLTFFPIIYLFVAIYTKAARKGPVIIKGSNHRLQFRAVSQQALRRMPQVINLLSGKLSFVGPGENTCIRIEDEAWYWSEWNTTFDLFLTLKSLCKCPL
jgi:hypothetical protein